MRERGNMVVTSYMIPLALVTSFRYLGRVLSVADDNCPGVLHNLRKAQQNWEWISRVLIREGVDARTLGRIYVTVVQAVMLYGFETWVMTPRSGRVLDGFHHRVARKLIVRQPRRGRYS